MNAMQKDQCRFEAHYLPYPQIYLHLASFHLLEWHQYLYGLGQDVKDIRNA